MTDDRHANPERRPDDEGRREEAGRILAGVERDSAPLLDSALRRGVAFFSAADAGDDPAEIWGRRVGRALAVLGGALCLAYLAVTYLGRSA